jgi:diacylglycerol O-acyltransferase / wax synthase
VSDPVTVAEASLLARDQESAPWQQVLVLVVSGGLTRAQLMARIAERISYAPRFRRVVAGWPVPGWVDDANFNLGGHVHEATLTEGQRLEDWLAAQVAVGLPRSHPLWDVTLVSGLAPGSQAVVARVHPALVDGYDNIHLFQELLDEYPEQLDVSDAAEWQPSETATPDLGSFVAGFADPLGAVERVKAGVLGMVENGVRTLAAEPRQHYLGHAEVDLDAIAAVRVAHGCTVHDVLICLATAGVRDWLREHHRPVADVTALVPLAVTEPQVLDSAIGCRIAAAFDGLPVTALTATQRLTAVATLSRARRDSGVSVPARDLVDLAGFAPATVHAVAAGAVGVGRPHSVVICNVPGPTQPRYVGTARVRRVYAVTTTTDAELMSISITSYRGRISLAVAAVAPPTRWAASINAELAALRAEAS